MWVASGLFTGLLALFLVLWFQLEDEQEPVGTAGKTMAVEGDEKLAEQGKQISDSNGCNACHTVDGTKSVGPTWKGVYGTEVELGGGGKAEVDERYISDAILDPNAEVRKGFGPSMPSYQGKLSGEDVKAIAEYIKSL